MRRDGGMCHRRRPTWASVKVALGDELVICLDDDAARDAELGCKGPGRRQDRVRRQPPGPDRLTESLLELSMDRRHVRPVEGDVKLER